MPLYVYGIMRAEEAAHAVAEGSQGAVAVESVDHGGVGALVSDVSGELRLRRENILAHADVLQEAFAHGPVLPFRFGTVLEDADALIHDLLAPRSEALVERLDELDGKAEMQVKAIYSEEPLLRSILAQDQALARAVQRTQQLPAAATHFDRIRIGEAITGAVAARGAADGRALLGSLAPLALANVISPPHHERAVMNVAFLVERANLARFDQAVEAVSEQRAGEIEFKLIGPLPPYSFVSGDLQAGNPSEVSAGWA